MNTDNRKGSVLLQSSTPRKASIWKETAVWCAIVLPLLLLVAGIIWLKRVLPPDNRAFRNAIIKDDAKVAARYIRAHPEITRYRNPDSGVAFVHSLVAKNRPQVLAAFLDAGADANAKDDKGQTPMAFAIQTGKIGIVRVLLDHKANVNGDVLPGSPALHAAILQDNIQLVRLLLDCRANIEVRDRNGETPLFCAASNGHLAICKLLIERGADVNTKNDSDSTPLAMTVLVHSSLSKQAKTGKHGAAFPVNLDEYFAVIRLLVDHGARVNVRAIDGRPLLSMATDPKVIAFLRTYGAKK